MTSYRDFAVKYESGMTIMEIAAQGEIRSIIDTARFQWKEVPV